MTAPQLEESAGFDRSTIDYIQRAAASGLYEIRGLGAKRRVPNFDDLLFLAASLSRYPLEGYRERCATKTLLGTRYATRPIELAIPITVAGMSFGALSARVKDALGRAATEVGTSTTTGDGGMTTEERASSKTLVYQCLPSRYGFNPDDVRRADAIEIVIGQGAKPGGGGMLLGQKVNPRVARMRTLPEGVDQRSASRHPDWTGPDDLVIKIKELREITDWEKPIYVKVGATRVFNDVKLAVLAGADVIVVDGMQGGTAATQTVFIEHVGIPTLAALRQAVDALDDLNMRGHRAIGDFRRHPQRRGRGQGDRHGRGCGGDRAGCPRGTGLQQRFLYRGRRARVRARGLRAARHRARVLPSLSYREMSGRSDDAGCGAGIAPGSRGRRQAAEELPEDREHGIDHHCARLRQAGRASSGERGSGGVDRGSGRHGGGAPGGNFVDPGASRLGSALAR
jgi:hypothetical protein